MKTVAPASDMSSRGSGKSWVFVPEKAGSAMAPPTSNPGSKRKTDASWSFSVDGKRQHQRLNRRCLRVILLVELVACCDGLPDWHL